MIEAAVLVFDENVSQERGHFEPSPFQIGGLSLLARNLMGLKEAGVLKAFFIGDGHRLSQFQNHLDHRKIDSRFPEIHFIEKGSRLIPEPPGLALVLNAEKIYDPKLFRIALARKDVFAYFSQDGTPADLGVLSPSHPIDLVSLRFAESQPLPQGTFILSVNSKEDVKKAEKVLFNSFGKETDGWFSRHLNRPVSMRISRMLAKFSLNPNVVTMITLFVGIASGLSSSMGTHVFFVLGGVLYQLASILDGVDGEIARAQFRSSKLGEWLDTICDDLTNLIYLAGVTVGLYRASFSVIWVGIGVAGLIIYCAAIGLMYWQLIHKLKSATLLTFQRELENPEFMKKKLSAVISILYPFLKRDFYGFFFMTLALLNLPWLIIAGFVFAITPTFIYHIVKVLRYSSDSAIA